MRRSKRRPTNKRRGNKGPKPAPLTRLDTSMVLYQDNHLLVVNKPAGTLTQGDDTGDPDLHGLAKQYIKEAYNKPGDVFLALVHRLDRPVSGVMVFPRTSKAASRVTRQFKERTIKKRYMALVEGKLEGGGKLVNYVWKDHRRVRIVDENHSKGLRAELTYRAIATKGGMTLVDIKLGTGRPHQIRVQMSHLGHPIVGDFRYWSRTEFDGYNLALHSYSLELTHPTLGDKIGWTQMPPPTWGNTFKKEIEKLVRGAK